VLTQVWNSATIRDADNYKQVTVRLHNKGLVLRQETAGREIKTKQQYSVRCGQFVYSRIDARNGAMGVVPPELDGAIVSNDFPVFDICPDRLLPDFLNYYTSTTPFLERCLAASSGTTNRRRLKEENFLAIAIPLPPLAEQQRIVARIEALAGRIAEAQGLQVAAITEADALWAAGAARVFRRLEDAPSKPIEGISEVRGGLQKSPNRAPRDHPTPYLTVAHVQRNFIDLSIGLRYFEISPRELPRWKLESGDVLIIEGNGSADQIGRAAIFRGEVENCVHQNHVIRVRPDRSLVLPEYLNGYLNSPVGMEEVRRRSRTTSGLLTLSVERIRAIELPIPSLGEQRKSIEALRVLRTRVDALRRLQTSTQAELAALLPAVLDKAFRGEL
jgi:type I restriction enzyme S subunit